MRIGLLNKPDNFHTQKWARALQKAGAEVIIFSFERMPDSEIPCVYVKPSFKLGKAYSYLSFIMGGKALQKALTEHKIDVVNALNVTPYGVWAARSKQKPLILSAFGADILEYPSSLSLRWEQSQYSWSLPDESLSLRVRVIQFGKNLVYRRLVKFALHNSELVLGDNQYLVDCMIKWFGISPQKCNRLIWGIDPSKFTTTGNNDALRRKYGLRDGQKLLLMPRGAKSIYNALPQLQAVPKILENHKGNLKIIMLSAGYELSSRVLGLADSLEADYPDFCLWKDLIPVDEMHLLWRETDFFISAPKYDGYSASLAEGRYAGAIPIVNDIPANRELLSDGKNALFMTSLEPDIICDTVSKAMGLTQEASEKIQIENRSWIENHSLIGTSAREFIKCCNELLATTRN